MSAGLTEICADGTAKQMDRENKSSSADLPTSSLQLTHKPDTPRLQMCRHASGRDSRNPLFANRAKDTWTGGGESSVEFCPSSLACGKPSQWCVDAAKIHIVKSLCTDKDVF